ncbi:MAG: hypothetical protein K5697_10110 [Lachnospiraceae bacterium]|nr:hypothetical protein [Lachnospiraceae bacterium]
MVIGFVIWSVIAVMFIGISIWAWNAKEAVGFFAGIKPPEVKDGKRYNHSVSILWLVYALLFEGLGVPFLFLKQNSAGFVIPYLGVIVITIGLVVAYSIILAKNR